MKEKKIPVLFRFENTKENKQRTKLIANVKLSKWQPKK